RARGCGAPRRHSRMHRHHPSPHGRRSRPFFLALLNPEWVPEEAVSQGAQGLEAYWKRVEGERSEYARGSSRPQCGRGLEGSRRVAPERGAATSPPTMWTAASSDLVVPRCAHARGTVYRPWRGIEKRTEPVLFCRRPS